MSKPWYESWFESKEYLRVYRHRNEEDALKLLSLLKKCFSLDSGTKVLDLACGSGRHSILLAKNGCDVTGVDLSPTLLAEADEAASGQNLTVRFLREDLRNVSFENEFDAALNIFTSFGYFEHDEENFLIFRNAWRALKTGGTFVFDFFNSVYLKRHLTDQTVDSFDGIRVEQRRRIAGNRVVKDIVIESQPVQNESPPVQNESPPVQNESPPVQSEASAIQRSFQESVRLFSCGEITSALVNTGFRIQDIFGDFDGASFDEQNSSRLIIVSRK